MVRWDTYKLKSTHRKLPEARENKDKLRRNGYRVKIRKNEDGLYQVWIKNILKLDEERG